MPRILADLPEDDIRWLDRLAEEQGKSRAAVLREAVSAYRGESSTDWIDRGFGLWKERTDLGDAAAWQRRERASSTRPWDDDYEDARGEFPELFDAEDDRQRQIHRQFSGKGGERP